ncbi:MAG: FkbM family methyltransferase, partial [Candidatus Paceibacterota bacterium]
MFDIGANVGYYTLLASKLVGRAGTVVALEPAVRNLTFLYRHVALNKADNVRVLPLACADSLSLAAAWWSGGVVEWWSGGVVEWWSGG